MVSRVASRGTPSSSSASTPSSSTTTDTSQANNPNRSEPKIALVTSKEWVVPPRPKPGRKPSKATEDTSSKKSTQRAFRERRQEYITELEEKVRSLEAGEGDKAVFFQAQAIKAKEEATQLRIENDVLKKKVSELQAQLARSNTSSSASSSSSLATSSTASSSTSASGTTPTATTTTTSSTTARSKRTYNNKGLDRAADDSNRPSKRTRRDSTASTISALDQSQCQAGRAPLQRPSPMRIDSDVETAPQRSVPQGMLEGSCGFCAVDSCLCAEIANYEPTTFDESPRTHSKSEASTAPSRSLNLLPSTNAISVPLKLRKRASDAPVATVWKFEPVAAAAAAVCSGDPSNCPACADDPFGKAFCESLSQSICSSQPCADCPSRHDRTKQDERRMPTPAPSIEELEAEETAALLDSFTDLPCCGQPNLCGSVTCEPGQESSDVVEVLPRSVPSGVRTVEDIPCSEAWSVLKSHPNIAFTNLQMLADVVAKRTRCDGPGPGSAPSSSPALGATKAADEIVQRRRLTVERGAVDQALELLDQGSLRK